MLLGKMHWSVDEFLALMRHDHPVQVSTEDLIKSLRQQSRGAQTFSSQYRGKNICFGVVVSHANVTATFQHNHHDHLHASRHS